MHESLLKAWPRLVRWQAQDEEGAVLRDQLKQAAHLWGEKGRTADLLWTGTAYREYELWRERYPGALTALEEDFARSMAEKARRKRRLLRILAAAAFVAITAAAAIGISRQRAVRGARLAEAARLVALGRVELDRYPTAALAYARKSLETADNAEARTFAVEALWRAPSARILPLPVGRTCRRAAFGPDGRRFAAYTNSEYVMLFDDDGRPPHDLGGFSQPGAPPAIEFSPKGDALAAGWPQGTAGGGISLRLRVVSVPDGRERGWVQSEGTAPPIMGWAPDPRGMLVFDQEKVGADVFCHLAPWDGGPRRPLGAARDAIDFAPVGDRLLLLREGRVRSGLCRGPPRRPNRRSPRCRRENPIGSTSAPAASPWS